VSMKVMIVCLALIVLSGVMFVFGGSLAGLAVIPLLFLHQIPSQFQEPEDEEEDTK
jgi:hypothetical protein